MKSKKIFTVIIVLILAGIYVQNNVYKTPTRNSIKGAIEVLADVSNQREIGEKKALKLVREYLEKNNSYIPNNIEIDSADHKYYTVHVFDIVTNNEESHTVTTGWYQVNKYTGEIIDIMQ